jgi:hypothetical protein
LVAAQPPPARPEARGPLVSAAVADQGVAAPASDDAGQRPTPPDVAAVVAPEPSSGSSDEMAESAFLAEARERGEVVKPAAEVDAVEEVDAKPLPALDELVARIPPEVRDTLEDLFRARFVTVKRVPRKALKR